MERYFDRQLQTPERAWATTKRVVRTVQRREPFAGNLEAQTGRAIKDGAVRKSRPIVADGQTQPAIHTRRRDTNGPSCRSSGHAVTDGVLHQRLQEKVGESRVERIGG